MKKPEILAPAGNIEKLETALKYGADAVYVGVPGLSLRTKTSEMTFESLKTGIDIAHDSGKRIYAALNIFPQNNDLAYIEETLVKLKEMNIDAAIVSDPGVIDIAGRVAKGLDLHLSTQANTTNLAAVKFWKRHGIKRVVLAREMSLEEIAQIAQNAKNVEVEAFVHGAMCMSYSGRCMLSSYMTGRTANHGECAQPCRWEYFLKETSRDVPMIIEEDERGTYIMNSKDLCLVDHIALIVASGISSIKIEGRMKSSYYVANVVRSYRYAIDKIFEDPDSYSLDSIVSDELKTVSNRGYTTGFYFSKPDETTHNYKTSGYDKQYDFVGVVSEYIDEGSLIKVAVRNQILADDLVEAILPNNMENVSLDVSNMKNESGEAINSAHNSYTVLIPVNKQIAAGTIIRRKLKK